jgi:hypothetical protein
VCVCVCIGMCGSKVVKLVVKSFFPQSLWLLSLTPRNGGALISLLFTTRGWQLIMNQLSIKGVKPQTWLHRYWTHVSFIDCLVRPGLMHFIRWTFSSHHPSYCNMHTGPEGRTVNAGWLWKFQVTMPSKLINMKGHLFIRALILELLRVRRTCNTHWEYIVEQMSSWCSYCRGKITENR